MHRKLLTGTHVLALRALHAYNGIRYRETKTTAQHTWLFAPARRFAEGDDGKGSCEAHPADEAQWAQAPLHPPARQLTDNDDCGGSGKAHPN